MPPAKTLEKPKDQVIDIPGLDLRRCTIEVKGNNHLIVHKWSSKAIREMLDKQIGKARKKKEAKIPVADFVDTLHIRAGSFPRDLDPQKADKFEAIEKLSRPEVQHGFPVVGFKESAALAWDMVQGIKKKQIRAAFHINSHAINELDDELAPITFKELQMREDMVRLQGTTADIRHRGQYINWQAHLDVVYNADVMSIEQLAHVLDVAGFGVGVGEWRPAKGGQYGTFQVEGFTESVQVVREHRRI